MKTKIQIKSLWGSVLFKFEKEDNTIKDTLEEAVKSMAYLRRADLFGADLSGADLSGADLSGADLSGADLRRADLRRADLRRADLRRADLSGADLRRADLRRADLSGADLSGADLSGAYLKKFIHLFRIIPEEGSFIAWKKGLDNCIIKLEIPAKAKRHNYIASRKCRAEFVKVLGIWQGKKKVKECINCTHSEVKTTYKVGEIVRADKYNPDPLNECSNGIHFFLTKQEAKDWNQ